MATWRRARWLLGSKKYVVSLLFPLPAVAAVDGAAAFLIDESTRHIVVLPAPAQAVPENPLSPVPWSAGVPFVAGKGILPRADATDTPLPQRLGMFAEVVRRQLPPMTWDGVVAGRFLRFLRLDQQVAQASGTSKGLWPPSVPLTLSRLREGAGVYFVFTIQSEKHPIERIDLMRFSESGEFTRTYWSRQVDDPSRLRLTEEVLTETAQKFMRQVRQKQRPDATGERLRLAVDRRIGESDLAAIEKAIQTLLKSNDSALTAVEVTSTDILFLTEAEKSMEVQLVSVLGKLSKGVLVRQTPGSEGLIRVLPASAGKE